MFRWNEMLTWCLPGCNIVKVNIAQVKGTGWRRSLFSCILEFNISKGYTMAINTGGMFPPGIRLVSSCLDCILNYISHVSKYTSVQHIFELFLQTVYAMEKLLAGFNVQPRIGMNQSLI